MLRLVGRQPGATSTFESVRPRIESRLLAEARLKAVESLVKDLKAKTSIQVDTSAIESLDAKVPSGPLIPSAPTAP